MEELKLVAKLANELNRKGSKGIMLFVILQVVVHIKPNLWVLWKTRKLKKKVGEAWLEKKYHLEIDRGALLLYV